MSFFKDDEIDSLKKSIDYFNSLDDEKKAFLVANVSATDKYNDMDFTYIYPILEAIENDISQRNEISLATKISELGMEHTYAQLFVKNVIEKRPTLDYQLTMLERMDEENFKDKFINTVRKFYFDFKPKKDIVDEEKISQQQFGAIIYVYQEGVRAILRGETNKNIIRRECKKQIKSDVKIETIVESIDTTKDKLRTTVMFSHAQDIFLDVQTIKEQNKVILESLKEILETIKDNKRNI